MFDLRFGLLPNSPGFKPKDWPKLAQITEELGYSTILKEDHFTNTRDDPISLLATAAAHTTKLKIGTAVLCVDFRHPAIIAQAASTLQQQSNGRFELGIGAGWLRSDYTQSGIPYDSPATRIDRLDEAIQIIKSLWTREKTSFKGKHYTITDMDQTGSLSEDELPKIHVGGGGKRILSVAGKHADIVSIIPRLEPSWPPKSIRDYSLDSIKEKISWVKDSAVKHSRDPEMIEFALYSPGNVLISDDVDDYIKEMSKSYQISEADFLSSPVSWVGSGVEVCERLKNINEETGINYFQFLIQPPNMMEQIERFSEQVIKPISIP